MFGSRRESVKVQRASIGEGLSPSPPKKGKKKKRQSLENFKEAGEDQERKNNDHIANRQEQVDIYTIYSATFRLGCGIDIN